MTEGDSCHRAPVWTGTELTWQVFADPASEAGRTQRMPLGVGSATSGHTPADCTVRSTVDGQTLFHPRLGDIPLPEGATVEAMSVSPHAGLRVAVLLRRGTARRAVCVGGNHVSHVDSVVELGPWLGRDEVVVIREEWPNRLPYRWNVDGGGLRPLLAASAAVVADVQRCDDVIGLSWSSVRQPRRIELVERTELLAGPVRLRPDVPSGPVPPAARVALVEGVSCTLPCLIYAPASEPRGTVVLLHGGPNGAHLGTWSPFADSLALDGWRVVLPNLRGSGLLDPALRPPKPDRYGHDDVDDVVSVIRHLGVGPIVLGGHSYGGYLAARAAHVCPQARGVFLLGGFLAAADLADSEHASVLAFLRSAGGRFVADRRPAPVPHFIAHGSADRRIPVAAMTSHADELGDGSEVIVADGEGHGVQTDAGARQVFPALFTWLGGLD
ncbi:alpha/beta hydrolase [Solihabitans fulvus]|uniref:Alpha/beta hydrolase n=1 Tax=Solihabitans fulvus TaxID=1892852 RepID=A0A5B2X9Z2_9PSEU|nr:alpha/beta fold hydrolase [Solihabitans fulvus]KAA2260468.1 alpha/beta hydrolase [Solihabitans fulvus]